MSGDRNTNRRPGARAGISLVEILVVIGIITIVLGLLVTTGKTARDSRRLSSARQQLALVAAAINRYADTWPAWKVGDVTIADKGWPDYIAGRMFPDGVFSRVTTFNYGPYSFSFCPEDFAISVPNASSCLIFALKSQSGRIAQLREAVDSNVKDIRSIFPGLTEPNYPAIGTGSRQRELLVDAWGQIVRYFWVYRDTEPNAAQRAHNGYLPVDCGPVIPGVGLGGLAASFNLPPGCQQSGTTMFYQPDGSPKRAVGFVLESAGPDGKFGNVWKANPTALEISEAQDNLIIKP